MSTFYLIRHAQKDAPEDVLSGRASGVHLSEHGRHQAEALAALFSTQPVERIFSSPLSRARETAHYLAVQKNLSMQISDAFDEVDFGAWTNLSFEKLEQDPHWRSYNTHRSTAEIPGGESMTLVQNRFVGELRNIARQFPRDHIAVISHREPILAAVLHFIGLSLDAWHHFEIDVASITTLRVVNDTAKLLALNNTAATYAKRPVAPEASALRAEPLRSFRMPTPPPLRRRI